VERRLGGLVSRAHAECFEVEKVYCPSGEENSALAVDRQSLY